MSVVKLARLVRSKQGRGQITLSGVATGQPSSHHARHASLVAAGRPDVVDLEDHLDELAREQDLRLLAVQALDHVLLLHVEVAVAHAVDAEGGVLLRNLDAESSY